MRSQLDDELMLIQDWRLREFCRRALDGMPDLFFELPASKSGKYHPIQSLGPGGLVRHCKMAVYFGLRMAKVYGLTKEDDIIIASLILHDIGKTWEKWKMGSRHEVLAVEYLETLPEAYRFKLVLDGVRWHMGPWSTGKPTFTDLSPLCQVVHLGDYAAAQKHLIVDFLYVDTELMTRKEWTI